MSREQEINKLKKIIEEQKTVVDELCLKIKDDELATHTETINGYLVKTKVSETVDEVVISIIVAYDNNGNRVQANVDVNNLFGGLITTTCFNNNAYEFIAAKYLEDLAFCKK